jgi:hypothetical protein
VDPAKEGSGRFSPGSLTSSSTTSANPFHQQPPRWCSNAPELSSALTAAVYVYTLFPHPAGSLEVFKVSLRSVCLFVQRYLGHNICENMEKNHDKRIATISSNGETKQKDSPKKLKMWRKLFFLDSTFDTQTTHTFHSTSQTDYALNEPIDQSEARTTETMEPFDRGRRDSINNVLTVFDIAHDCPEHPQDPHQPVQGQELPSHRFRSRNRPGGRRSRSLRAPHH